MKKTKPHRRISRHLNGECSKCGKEMSKKNIGQHEKRCGTVRKYDDFSKARATKRSKFLFTW